MKAEIRDNLISFYNCARWQMANEMYADEVTNLADRQHHQETAEKYSRRLDELWNSIDAYITAVETAAEKQ